MKKVIMVTSVLLMGFMTAFTNDSIARGHEHQKPAPRYVQTQHPAPTVKVKVAVAHPKMVVVVKNKPAYHPNHRPTCEDKRYAHKHHHNGYNKYACNYCHH